MSSDTLHTQDSICYYVTDTATSQPGGVFTGDTLFMAPDVAVSLKG